jgi:hypothetical protein
MFMYTDMDKDLDQILKFMFRFKNIRTRSEYLCFDLESSASNLNVLVSI